MYEVGDLIIYGNTGVCEVMGLTTLDGPGVEKNERYYVLNPLYQDGVIYSPADRQTVFMRPVISAEEAQHLIETIPDVQAEAYHNSNLSMLSEHYAAALQTHDCADLIELTMSIYSKKLYQEQQRRKFGQVDERYMKRAENLLFGELAAALDISIDEVQQYISSCVGAGAAKKRQTASNPS